MQTQYLYEFYTEKIPYKYIQVVLRTIREQCLELEKLSVTPAREKISLWSTLVSWPTSTFRLRERQIIENENGSRDVWSGGRKLIPS